MEKRRMEMAEVMDSQWESGKVIAGRYTLVGKVWKKPELLVFKAKDEKLQIPCYILVSVTLSRSALRQVAWNIMHYESEQTGPVVHGMYRAAGEDIVIFSCGGRTPEETDFCRWFSPKEKPPETAGRIQASLRPEMAKRVLAAGTILNRRYEILAPLGIGGFGVTYLCLDRVLLRNIAVKEYFPESCAVREGQYVSVPSAQALQVFRDGCRLFWQEILLTVRMNAQKNLPTVYDAFEENDTVYMVMRYESGESVGREYRARSYLPYTPIRMGELILPMLDGLAYLHRQDVLHCDISPANVIHRGDGEIVLIDFGSAWDQTDKDSRYNVTALKKDFAAPEQYINAKAGHMAKKIGTWTDLYAVGAVMYYLLTGEKAPDAWTRMETKEKLQLPKDFDGNLKKGWLKLIQQCMEIEPEKRVKSAEELRQRMERLLRKER